MCEIRETCDVVILNVLYVRHKKSIRYEVVLDSYVCEAQNFPIFSLFEIEFQGFDGICEK